VVLLLVVLFVTLFYTDYTDRRDNNGDRNQWLVDTLLLHCCYNVVTLYLFHCSDVGNFAYGTINNGDSSMADTMPLHWCYTVVTLPDNNGDGSMAKDIQANTDRYRGVQLWRQSLSISLYHYSLTP
jgi:hypothetical protein